MADVVERRPKGATEESVMALSRTRAFVPRRKLKNDVQEKPEQSLAANSARSLAPKKFSPPRVHPKVQEAFDRYRDGFKSAHAGGVSTRRVVGS